MTDRRLTISYLREPSGGSPDSFDPPKPERVVPFLRMRGKWLRAAGFEIGRRVAVEVSSGRLVLTVER